MIENPTGNWFESLDKDTQERVYQQFEGIARAAKAFFESGVEPAKSIVYDEMELLRATARTSEAEYRFDIETSIIGYIFLFLFLDVVRQFRGEEKDVG